jgi:hypothetical protein
MAAAAALGMASAANASGQPPAQGFDGFVELSYSVITLGGATMTLRLSSPARIQPPISEPLRPTSRVQPVQRLLTRHWRAAGARAPDLAAISGATELWRLPGPWGVSFDYN